MQPVMPGHAPVILVAEDDPGDQELIQRALESTGLEVDCRIVDDGEAALDYLLERGAWKELLTAHRPHLVLLDLNLPKRTGLEVLTAIRQSPALKGLAVVIYSTSSRKEDMIRSYDLGCAGFFVKPTDATVFIRTVSEICNAWLVREPMETAEK